MKQKTTSKVQNKTKAKKKERTNSLVKLEKIEVKTVRWAAASAFPCG